MGPLDMGNARLNLEKRINQMLEDKIEELEELLWTINDQLFDHYSKDWNLEGNKK